MKVQNPNTTSLIKQLCVNHILLTANNLVKISQVEIVEWIRKERIAILNELRELNTLSMSAHESSPK